MVGKEPGYTLLSRFFGGLFVEFYKLSVLIKDKSVYVTGGKA